MTHDELLRRMSGDELAHWIALYRREQRDREAEEKRSERMSGAGRGVSRI